MKIRHFHGEKIHGYLGFSLAFKPDLTFLTGINGSGKTSAVRAITALLAPSVRDLANMAYKTVSVTVEHEGSEITIESERSEQEISFSCSGVNETLQIPVLKPEAYEPRGHFAERERDFYREQEVINGRNPVLAAIENLPTPMFLDLERRFQAGTRQRREVERFHGRAVPANPLGGSVMESLSDAQSLAEQTYRQLLASRAELTDELKQEIILTAFDLGTRGGATQRMVFPSAAVLKQIERNEQLVPGALSRIGISVSLCLRVSKPGRPSSRGASPGVQLILATHSPSIIKGRIDNCVDVQEARCSDRLLT